MKVKENQAITLVALIITIVVLIILSAITIKSLVDTNIVKKSLAATEKYQKEAGKEIGMLNEMENLIGKTKEDNSNKEPDEEEKDLGTIEGAIKFGELRWNNRKASVVVMKTTIDNYAIEYEIENEAGDIVRPYKTIENGGTIIDLNLEDTIYARLTDGEKHTLNTASLTIQDKKGPIITIGIESIGNDSIAITTTAIDNEAGISNTPEYKYYIKQSTTENYPKEPNGTGKNGKYTYSNLSANISYDIKVETTDIVGNLGSSENKNITTKENLTQPNVQVTSASGTKQNIDGLDYYNKANGTITVVITDTASNTSATKLSYKITAPDGTTKTGNGVAPETKITNTEYGFTVDGAYRIEAWAEGKDGRKSETKTINFGRDTTPPVITNITSIGTSETTADVTVYGNDGRGIGIMKYNFYKGGEFNISANGTTSAIGKMTGLTTGGTNACTVTAVDRVGNESIATSTNVATKEYRWMIYNTVSKKTYVITSDIIPNNSNYILPYKTETTKISYMRGYTIEENQTIDISKFARTDISTYSPKSGDVVQLWGPSTGWYRAATPEGPYYSNTYTWDEIDIGDMFLAGILDGTKVDNKNSRISFGIVKCFKGKCESAIGKGTATGQEVSSYNKDAYRKWKPE